MKFSLVHNWSDVLKFAWSWRLAFGGALFSAIDVGLELYRGGTPSAAVIILGLLSFCAAVSRVIGQSNLAGPTPADYQALVQSMVEMMRQAQAEANLAAKVQTDDVPSPAALRTMAAEGGAIHG